MTNDMLPILRMMHDAEGDRALVRLLLACTAAVLITYQGVILAISKKASTRALPLWSSA